MDIKVAIEDPGSEFQKYLRISERTRSNEFNASADHLILSPAFNYWLNITKKLESEYPKLINVNIFSKFNVEGIDQLAKEIYPLTLSKAPITPTIEKHLLRISEKILSPIMNCEQVYQLAGAKEDYRYFGSESPRIFFRASCDFLNGVEIATALHNQETYFECEIKYRDRFLRYWKNYN